MQPNQKVEDDAGVRRVVASVHERRDGRIGERVEALDEILQPVRVEGSHRLAEVPEVLGIREVRDLFRVVIREHPRHDRVLAGIVVAPSRQHVQVEEVIEVRDAAFDPPDRQAAQLLVEELGVPIGPLLDGLRRSPLHDRESGVVPPQLALVPRPEIEKEGRRRREQPVSAEGGSAGRDEEQLDGRVPQPVPAKVHVRELRKVPPDGFRPHRCHHLLTLLEVLLDFLFVDVVPLGLFHHPLPLRRFTDRHQFSLVQTLALHLVLEDQVRAGEQHRALSAALRLDVQAVVEVPLDQTRGGGVHEAERRRRVVGRAREGARGDLNVRRVVLLVEILDRDVVVVVGAEQVVGDGREGLGRGLPRVLVLVDPLHGVRIVAPRLADLQGLLLEVVVERVQVRDLQRRVFLLVDLLLGDVDDLELARLD
mmetsp:Transcript_7393/g.18080  ORF Transcript_7393/g.18080 Transcript_7393/m.18080 type:complete len:423 (-) Transcript_7393:2511-3779(-)